MLLRVFVFRVTRRLRFGYSYFSQRFKLLAIWSTKRTESDNFYYPLTEKNYDDLAAGLSLILRVPRNEIAQYFQELLRDPTVGELLSDWKSRRPELRDSTMSFGRRVVWYAIARIKKPTLIVETGVHHGLGSVALCAALLRNESEGFPGAYIGTDINRAAGSLLSEPFSSVGELRYGDSLETLEALDRTIDLFINDSDHSADYEMREYLTIAEKLSEAAVVLGDNSHSSNSLREWSESVSRSFILLREEPVDHWYPGAGIGISVSEKQIFS